MEISMVMSEAALTWGKNYLENQGYSLQKAPHVVRSMPWSQVSCFDTNTGLVYLKSMAPPFATEPILLTFLHTKGLSNMPSIIAVNPSLSCFLVKDAGVPLRSILKQSFAIEIPMQALNIYASIQISCIAHVNTLLEKGINDWRLAKLPSLYKALLGDTSLLISDGLTQTEIDKLQYLHNHFALLCNSLSQLGIPETLEHGDFHDNNILVKGENVTVNDFGDASISHPFFSIISFLNSTKRNHELTKDNLHYHYLKKSYLEKWSAYGSKETLLTAFDIASLLRPFVFALNFARIKLCPAIGQFPEYNGYIANSLRNLINNLVKQG